MRKALILRFFKELDQELKQPVDIILTGAAAGSLLGVVRPSLDIDFEIRPRTARRPARFSGIRDTIERVAEKVGVAVNYSEDIRHWSMIDSLDYRKSALNYRTFGRLRLKIMEPAHWTIGKMSRFLEVDIRDVVQMIKRKRLKPEKLISLWARALRSSALSLNLGIFRGNVIHFIKRHGRRVWGESFDPEKSVVLFEKSTRLKSGNK